MAGSVNIAMILGNLGKDPEVRTMQNGDKIVTFSMATSESWRDKASGEKRENVTWHNIVIFNTGIAEIAEKYLRKGSKCMVTGSLTTRKWQDKDGADRYTTEVVIGRFKGELVLLDGAPGAEERAPRAAAAPAKAASGWDVPDDDPVIPF